MDFSLRVPGIVFGDFMLPRGMVMGFFCFFVAWLAVGIMERLRLTPHVRSLPLFFVAPAAALLMYGRYFGKPGTRDALVRANDIGVAPRVAAPMIESPIRVKR